MMWHSVTVSSDELNMLVVAIAWGGGTITSSAPCPDGVRVTYVTDQPGPLPGPG
ncbi:hypothetical protein [Nocardioides bizhenqiangii]|uniref:Uncharacterized protein n=1 Tax=Nocardioides bizhenqiangii TaxID=3095076 RepID=A0ABZ0ZPF2_9ACTN|nr:MULTISPECIES: hypothetical protein [unclassified Nocardioides]MDZ5619747.1 hypothetical protein [Nocardioides sp. HM23]WQQ26246.1 hypothetical protein SHK19_20070 [Nocardioides sp. HM61]